MRLPVPRTTDQQLLRLICELLVEIRDRLPTAASVSPVMVGSGEGVQLREPAVVPSPEPPALLVEPAGGSTAAEPEPVPVKPARRRTRVAEPQPGLTEGEPDTATGGKTTRSRRTRRATRNNS